jgi:phage baseplate assembly protein W
MITISNLSNKKNINKPTFVDLNLDFQMNQVSSNRKNADVVLGNDLIVDTDDRAIMNSIQNILSQKRYLNPAFNIDLSNFIGQPLSDMGATALGNTIDKGIALFEPRVKVQKILVATDHDTNTYVIAIILVLPNLGNKQLIINSSLSNTGDFIIHYK